MNQTMPRTTLKAGDIYLGKVRLRPSRDQADGFQHRLRGWAAAIAGARLAELRWGDQWISTR